MSHSSERTSRRVWDLSAAPRLLQKKALQRRIIQCRAEWRPTMAVLRFGPIHHILLIVCSRYRFLHRVSIACYAKCCISYRTSVRLSVCLSVRPSVRRWHCVKTTPATIVLSSLEDSPMTSFLMVNFGAKIQREHRERGHQMRDRVGKIGNFSQ